MVAAETADNDAVNPAWRFRRPQRTTCSAAVAAGAEEEEKRRLRELFGDSSSDDEVAPAEEAAEGAAGASPAVPPPAGLVLLPRWLSESEQAELLEELSAAGLVGAGRNQAMRFLGSAPAPPWLPCR